jgi:hypothetical protein
LREKRDFKGEREKRERLKRESWFFFLLFRFSLLLFFFARELFFSLSFPAALCFRFSLFCFPLAAEKTWHPFCKQDLEEREKEQRVSWQKKSKMGAIINLQEREKKTFFQLSLLSRSPSL